MKEKEFYLAVGVKSFEDDKLSVCSNALLNSDAMPRKPGCQLVTKLIAKRTKLGEEVTVQVGLMGGKIFWLMMMMLTKEKLTLN